MNAPIAKTLQHQGLVLKSAKLANVCYDIRGPVLARAREMEEEGHRVIKLNIGNLAPFGFDAPEEIVQDVIHNLPELAPVEESEILWVDGAHPAGHVYRVASSLLSAAGGGGADPGHADHEGHAHSHRQGRNEEERIPRGLRPLTSSRREGGQAEPERATHREGHALAHRQGAAAAQSP